jgi:hypothetical protein
MIVQSEEKLLIDILNKFQISNKSSSSSDVITIETQKQEFINNETEKPAIYETTRVEPFISHFLITDTSSMEEIRWIVQSIIRKK